MSRRLLLLLASGSLVGAFAGASGHSGARAATSGPASAAAPSEANLDWAVETSGGGWCTAARPQPELTALPLTIEGWFRARGRRPTAVLVDVWDPSSRGSWVRLTVGDALGLHVESGTAPSPAASSPWTHFALRLRTDGASVTTWDAEHAERRSTDLAGPSRAPVAAPLVVCVGEAGAGGERLDGLLDEVRIWAAELTENDVRAWRHRRVTDAHPARKALLAYWPFRAGHGASEADGGRLGPLQARAPAWVALSRLDFGPLLRNVDQRSARVLFHARDVTGAEGDWSAALEIAPDDLDSGRSVVTTAVRAVAADDSVAHVALDDLEPQTRYVYAPLIEGRRGLDPGPGGFPSFTTRPDLGGRNADFTAAFFADQHTPAGTEPPRLEAYEVAAKSRPLFWAQLGDVATGALEATPEGRRTRAELQALWERNYAPGTPQAAFAGRFGLALATISDHEIHNNYSLNWHAFSYGTAASPEEATLHDRVAQYDRSLGRWWRYFAWGDSFDDRLGRVAERDRGESVMAETPVPVRIEAGRDRACLAGDTAGAFRAGDFVSLAEDGADPVLTRVKQAGADPSCPGGLAVTLADAVARSYLPERGATLAVGARYASHGHYRSWQPFPFVQFFVADTTSYRGDPYERKDAYAREANRDRDHARYPWDAGAGTRFIHGDRLHGANRTTDGVRSWLGPTQRRALLEALAGSTAPIVVVAAGYPLHSVKFEGSDRYWEGRESGFDFAPEADEILAALEKLDRLVLWVHGDGHTPALVRLRRNVYQLEIGATMPSSDRPGHYSRNLTSGGRSRDDVLGGGELIAGHQPDLNFGDDVADVFYGRLDQFAGYLRLYFHPGQEALRSSESAGLRRLSDHEVAMAAESDPAMGGAARHVVGKVVRLRRGEESLFSVVTAYRYEPGRAVLTLKDAIVRADPDELRVLIDATPWVESRWFDARGHEWRDFSFVMRKDL
jgi:hypothetical protein